MKLKSFSCADTANGRHLSWTANCNGGELQELFWRARSLGVNSHRDQPTASAAGADEVGIPLADSVVFTLWTVVGSNGSPC